MSSQRLSRAWPWVLVLLAAGAVTAISALFYPGGMTADTVTQLAQAKGLSPLSDWHPPIIALIWRGLLELTGGREGSMLVLQCALLWCALGLLAMTVYRLTGSRGCSLLPLLVGLVPQVFVVQVILWKDAQMAYALALAFALAAWLRHGAEQPTRLTRCLVLIAGLILLVYAVLTRWNAVPAVLPVLWYLGRACFPSTTWRRTVAVFAAWLFLIAGVQSGIQAVAKPLKTHLVATVMLDDVFHLASPDEVAAAFPDPVMRYRFLIGQRACLDGEHPVNNYLLCVPHSHDYRYIYGAKEIQAAWPGIVLRHLPQYVRYRAWAFSKSAPKAIYLANAAPVHDPSTGIGLRYAHPTFVGRYVHLVNGWERDRTWAFAWWTWIGVAAATLLLGFTARRLRAAILTLSSSALLYAATFTVSTMGGFYRYIYWTVLAALLAVVLLAVDWGSRRRHSARRGDRPAARA